jgi:hypothetical protein
MDVTKIVEDLTIKREYVAKRLGQDPLPGRDEAAAAVRSEISALGLAEHAVALETEGYTVLRPDEVGAGDLVDRLNPAIDRAGERRAAEQSEAAPTESGVGTTLFHLVQEDPVFEEVLLAPKPLALLTYLLGYHAKLNQCTGLLKPKGTPPLQMHADAGGKFPIPWPETAQVANVTWLLSDYTRDHGCLCVVPGSHRRNPPNPSEDHGDQSLDGESIVAIEAPKGSVVVWHGGLWHGAFSRKTEGLRRTLVLYYARAYIEAQEMYKLTTTLEMLERNPARFGVQMGLTDLVPWGQSGPKGDPYPVSGTTPFQ